MRDGRRNANLPSALVPSDATCTKSAEIVLILLNHASARVTSSLAIDGIAASMIGKLTRNITLDPKPMIRAFIIIHAIISAMTRSTIDDFKFCCIMMFGITSHHFRYQLAEHRVCQHDSPLK